MADIDDLQSHEEMWCNFVRLLAFAAAASAASLILMAIFLL
jgi:hypothetical protein